MLLSTPSEPSDARPTRPWPADRVEHWPIERLTPYADNPRLHSEAETSTKSLPPVIVACGWSEEEKRAYRLADNQLAARANWDPDLLGNELRELEFAGFDFDWIGFDPDQLETILAGLGPSGLTDPDAVPEVPDQPVARLGDLWLLGDHRVGCGDSTRAADVAPVLAGSAPHLMIADPPYRIDYPARRSMTRFSVRARL